MIVIKTGDQSWFDDWYVFAHNAKQKAFRVRSLSRTQADREEHREACRQAQLVYYILGC